MTNDWLGRLEDAVKEDGRSLRAISRAAGLGPNYLGELLNKQKEPGVDKLVRLCAELKISATYILTGVEVSAEEEQFLQGLSKLSEDGQATVRNLVRQLQPAPKAEQ